jgi:thiamine-monophosphate kinase
MQKRGELGLIQQIRRLSTTRSPFVRLGIGDDCAVLRPPRGADVLVTTDFTLEGRHFRRDWHTPESVGHRCLARGLSDLAAMGAQPLAAFLSLALPQEMATTSVGRRWTKGFFSGLQALAAQHHVPLAGGDTAESPASLVLADIVLVGAAPRGRELRRSGARPGDLLYVTGNLGGAAVELDLLRQGKRLPGHPQLFPAPRLAIGRALLSRRLATACIDLSDGLSTDLAHLCEESAVGANLDSAALPIHGSANLTLALHGGEDYELLFTARPGTKMPRSIVGVAITRIGSIAAKPKRGSAILIDGQPLAQGGWEHFRG